MPSRRTLVVGTTADYVDAISRSLPGKAAFLTDRQHRAEAAEPPPAQADEALCDLADSDDALAALGGHMARWNWQPDGVACFDCESMALAARLAGRLGLPYPSLEAVAACRSKFASKLAWQRHDLPCPEVSLVRTAEDALRMAEELAGPIVLKPLTGSGSELVFLCRDADEIAAAMGTLATRLADHHDHRMYAAQTGDGKEIDPRHVFVAEEYVAGDEYSCDFLLDEQGAQIIRIARKVLDARQPVGTTLAYVVAASLPAGLDVAGLAEQVHRAASALGLRRALGMLDFIVRDGRAFMIEMAPRPGGDCLPPLLRQSGGVDILGMTLALARGERPAVPPPSEWKLLVGLRVFATQAGTIRRIRDESLRADRRVVECHLRRGPGWRVSLPPEDYDSRILGYAIFRPSSPRSIEAECLELAEKIQVEFESPKCRALTTS